MYIIILLVIYGVQIAGVSPTIIFPMASSKLMLVIEFAWYPHISLAISEKGPVSYYIYSLRYSFIAQEFFPICFENIPALLVFYFPTPKTEQIPARCASQKIIAGDTFFF